MKKLFSVLLVISLLLAGCTVQIVTPDHAPDTAIPTPQPSETGTPGLSGQIDGELVVHFLDVGQADSILIECGGEAMLIDGGNVDDGQMIVSYLDRIGIEELAVVVNTHPHEDHVGGLASVMAVFPTKRVLGSMNNYGTRAFDNFLHYIDQQGLELEIPLADQQFTLGGAVFTVLGPINTYPEVNDMSLVLMMEYGDTSFLFTGDMEKFAEDDMLNYHKGKDLEVDVLKVGHHGSSSSTGYYLLHETDPDYAVISVAAVNDYGHPHDEVISRLEDAEITLFRTDKLGTIIARSDGENIVFTWDNQSADPENLEKDGEGTVFIGNANSKKLHTESCSALPKEENRVYFDSLEDALEEGYELCGNCMG